MSSAGSKVGPIVKLHLCVNSSLSTMFGGPRQSWVNETKLVKAAGLGLTLRVQALEGGEVS